MHTTTVTGLVRSSNGARVEGALVEAYLAQQMSTDMGITGNDVVSTFTNAYGRFWLELSPTGKDTARPNNYYIFKILNSTTNYYYKTVPESTTTIEFEDLPSFVSPELRTPFLGSTTGGGLLMVEDFTGMFSYISVNGNGTEKSFTAPGKVHLVVLNGIVQNPAGDFTQVTANTVEFGVAPLPGDIIYIQYKV